jgi:hypothetical protein
MAVKHIHIFAAHDARHRGDIAMNLWKGAQLAPISSKLVLLVIGGGFCLGLLALGGH